LGREQAVFSFIFIYQQQIHPPNQWLVLPSESSFPLLLHWLYKIHCVDEEVRLNRKLDCAEL
jgi:hypothetical protein